MAQLRVALAALVALGGLAACDGDPEPEIADPTSSPTAPSASPVSETTSPTASSGPEEPPLPATATENSDAGALAFIEHWVDLLNYAGATGDTEALAALSHDRCEGCQSLVKLIDDTYSGGGRIEGGSWSIGPLRTLPGAFGADRGGFAEAEAAEQRIVRGDGEMTGYPGGPFHLYAYVSWTKSAWTMRWLRTPEANQ